MAVRSKRLAGPVEVAGTVTVIVYTVPAGETAIIRSLVVANGGAAPIQVRVGIDPAGAAATANWWRGTVPAGGVAVLPYLVLNAGDRLTFSNDTAAAPVTVTLAGSEIEGVAS